ncbi:MULTISPECIES: hypothetical protein [Streptomyces]|jgi:hypothetical protein|uniref:hypothetical protein n=1 Tax=Streptomyces TaxID=1883 RepID=UPI0002F955E1|nr:MULTISPECIES: hypothetical protein [Streptomyces]MYS47644.1 hypothetical protein [Streptomyces sp. SID5998]MYX43069.1 hypothetical protein [Streptomyces sp. SID89]NED78212.1 hypothetical protein [Streptomyces sp. SID9944]MBY8865796.1 hypothetical protein [Streptomyces sennicomposti]MYX30687.1 hypothetical protein [Streptomyces sp. SID8381]
MLALFLFLVLVAVVLGVIGVAASGLMYLLIIGIVVFVADVLLLGLRLGGRRGRRPAR